MDIMYGSSWSFLLDVKIVLRTVPAVLARRGAA
jgi:lipopolysaccharide/colanic/teichoic acid biosynthesis glycosyltransferase